MKKLKFKMIFLVVVFFMGTVCSANNPEPQSPTQSSSSVATSPLLFYVKKITDSFSRRSPDKIAESTSAQVVSSRSFVDSMLTRDPLLPWQRTVVESIERSFPGFVCTVASDNTMKVTGDFTVGERSWQVRTVNGKSVELPSGISTIKEKEVSWAPQITIAPAQVVGSYDIDVQTPNVRYFATVNNAQPGAVLRFKDVANLDDFFRTEQMVKRLNPKAPVYGE